jgi:phosphatidate phosphatase LPIN
MAAAEAAEAARMAVQINEPMVSDSTEEQRGQVTASGGKGRSPHNLRKFHSSDHPFSDSEENVWLRPDSYSRSLRKAESSPVSDTEVEIEQRKEKMLADSEPPESDVMWDWGGLPQESPRKADTEDKQNNPDGITIPKHSPKASSSRRTSPDHENPSLLTSVMRLVGRARKSKRFSEGDHEDGVYLDQIDNAEQAAQYFTSRHVETGTSKQHETVVMIVDDKEIAIDSGMSSDQERAASPLRQASEKEESGDFVSAIQSVGDVKLSLCGGLKDPDTTIPEETFLQHEVTFDTFCEKPSLMTNQNLVVKLGGRFYNWQVAMPIILSVVAFQKPLPQKKINSLVKEHMGKKRRLASWFTWNRRQANENANDQNQTKGKVGSDQVDSGKSEKSERLFSSDEDVAAGEDESRSETPRKQEEAQDNGGKKEYKKSLRLSSDQIRKLNLRLGANEAIFSVTTKYQGTTKAKSTIYLWHYTDKIVISDVDGTITKSDLYGQILPFFGHPWAQSGVTELFTSISDNGYQFLYLSSRAIGQARTTRGYLKNLKQGEISLPDGPLLLSPNSLYSAFRQEVILRKPEEFKKAALQDIKSLFPASVNPFYAGFGNRINDEWAYKDMGVPQPRIFIINPKGEVVHALSCTLQTSYSKLRDEVNTIFPPLTLPLSAVSDEYTDVVYWRDPLVLLGDDLPV